jgi:hypothetical protein
VVQYTIYKGSSHIIQATPQQEILILLGEPKQWLTTDNPYTGERAYTSDTIPYPHYMDDAHDGDENWVWSAEWSDHDQQLLEQLLENEPSVETITDWLTAHNIPYTTSDQQWVDSTDLHIYHIETVEQP